MLGKLENTAITKSLPMEDKQAKLFQSITPVLPAMPVVIYPRLQLHKLLPPAEIPKNIIMLNLTASPSECSK